MSSTSTHQAHSMVCLLPSDFSDQILTLPQPTETLPSPAMAPGLPCSTPKPQTIPPGIKEKQNKIKKNPTQQQQNSSSHQNLRHYTTQAEGAGSNSWR